MSQVTALIVAAGSGSRMGGDLPKQYRLLAGKPVLRRAVEALIEHPRIDAVRVVIGIGQHSLAADALDGLKVGELIVGGAERADSVRAGLEAIGADIVLIHDAARPFCPPEVIDRLLDAVGTADGAVPVLPVADTLAKGDQELRGTVSRTQMLRVQTPQAYHAEDLLYAMDEAGKSADTDESTVLQNAGLRVATVTGDEMLHKLTSARDWERAEMMLGGQMVSRVGMGFDVHAFNGPGPVVMGGIEMEHEHGLAGHSDADVVLHAITDALLGAAALGDIGQHFPPSEPQWKGASSDRFLVHAADLIRARGGVIDHVDCTVICEAPKVGPHRATMRARVADILDIAQDRVSIKATTTEQLGFTGRREGIAAQAVASIRLPA
ncbi:bifunctional 2-C-methyl-D-erythritol 4-phosphate cytidylyltransferase/2-C-methyl-D-erythritol 2,4-cyclodiphosphate synthase [Sphingomonas sp. BN140010]|uniref:Bifunctional enzyme IspD/IspF n=1 Tax=Sphingomonas arvum TaxID=2992113 RepID=A0ABT3JEJ9_9SPHN|nr:bifunctional 2-C-methyl-D-erythritol 4-phosphate cytidylyltransferase/2-C-methyl-D-erythritol 2,4-cyclodiphosphate synthase [Sphingomonas sp. BN140010]MCW3797498.1 bifunctional 2-C-methyl-D-erythritol 4-phosphate cytidylyltransferase/2-C-methyl-D-erythritol 2,4-cyclodiphosphate synthase [Sphingomonas sp. BN140010]